MYKNSTLIIALVLVLTGTIVHAQDDMLTVGLLSYDTVPFIEEMAELGYVEGENVEYITLAFEAMDLENMSFDEMSMEAAMEDIFAQIQGMMERQIDIFVTQSDSEALFYSEITGDIPIVFSISDDPVSTGVVADLTSPGGNITGVVSNQHHPRRLQLLTEINPATDVVYYLYSTLALEGEIILNQVQALGEELGVEVVGVPIPDFQSAFEALENIPEGTDWIFLTPYLFFGPEFDEALVAASLEHQAPVANFLVTPMQGQLIGYGPDLTETLRQSAHIVDLIYRGASPADIPVVIAENHLTVNLAAAEDMNYEIPVAILRQANTIVRPGDPIINPYSFMGS